MIFKNTFLLIVHYDWGDGLTENHVLPILKEHECRIRCRHLTDDQWVEFLDLTKQNGSDEYVVDLEDGQWLSYTLYHEPDLHELIPTWTIDYFQSIAYGHEISHG